VPAGKLNTPYRARIVAYCAREGIVVPRSFDIAKSTDRLVVIDVTDDPPTLVKRSTYLIKDVQRLLDAPENAGRRFRVLDFKRGCELKRSADGAFVRDASFAHRVEGEVLYRVQP
jgi:hypothetical protein